MHDLGRIRQDLQESLSLDKHPVALLIGAGCPSSVRVPNSSGTTDALIPDIVGLTGSVVSAMSADPAFLVLSKQFSDDGKSTFTIEDLLSRIRILRRIVGNGEARGLNATGLLTLEKQVCQHIVEAVKKILPPEETPYHRLADWIGGVARQSPIELFTTNYDLLIEQALEERGLPFFDGFVGARRPFFDLRAVEDDAIPPRWTRLWKLHGCLTWCLDGSGNIIRRQQHDGTSEGLLIHPSELKYDQSRRMPYLAMIDRLKAFIRKPSALLVTLGYAFGDEHLNEVIIQGLRGNPNAAVFGLLYKTLSQEASAAALSQKLPPNLSLIAKDRGVIRGTSAEWFTDTSPSGSPTPVTNDLGDFAVFTDLLKSFVKTPRL